MRIYIANAVGILAVILFVLSYLQKNRRSILILNVISRILYIIQYIILFAFAGAVLDILGTATSVLADKKDKPFIKKYLPFFILLTTGSIILAGVLLYKTPLDIFPIFGILFQAGAFWLTDEKKIRILSLTGSPCWFIYNFGSRAYGSAVGDALTMVSITTSIIRYDILKKTKK